jgi:hypothetical protein
MGFSEESVAKRLGSTASSVRGREAAPLRNLPLGTVIAHCEAMGGRVELHLVLPDGTRKEIGP